MPSASTSPLQPGFMVIHGNRLEDLRGVAVEWMKRHPLAPLENETILVQSNGISQWMKLALAANADDTGSGGMGIAAALDVTLPARFLWQSYRTVLTHCENDPNAVPATSPFDKSRLTWRLLRLLPELLEEGTFAPLKQFLEDDDDLRKHHQLAERLADLFDQYQVYRADWLEAWGRGEDVLIGAHGDATPLDEGQCWQPALWRALREDVGREAIDSSRAMVHQRFLAAAKHLTPDNRPPGLPRRILVFGISSLPQQALEALAALAACCQVVLCVHNPCRHYWADIIEHRDLLRARRYRQSRKAGMPERLDILGDGEGEADLHLHAQPLLAAWGKQGRDYLRLLDEHDERHQYESLFAAESLRIDLFEPHGGDCLLHQLQDDIRELRPLPETRDHWPAVACEQDDSIVFHVAHGPQREVEILHDQLLAAFSADPELRPRDIIVMVPDIDRYAPHIQAVFGQFGRDQRDRDDPRHIPFTLSDQGRRHRLPLLIALEKLLRLPELRLSVSDLLDLLEVPALRARFGIEEDHLPTLHRWIQGAGIRWGLNADQRASLDLPGGLEQNTWRFGLRRLLLGYAVGDATEGAWQGIEPFDDIGGLEAQLAGPLSALLDTLERQWHALHEETDANDWVRRLRRLLEECFRAEAAEDSLMLAQLEQALQAWQESTEEAGLTRDLPLSIVREHWLAQVDEQGLSQRFLAGAVNFATLMPMRAIPFKHVCLLGMNDGDYPRSHPPLDFDLMGNDYRPGDRSRREDDRYLFLEALLSARRQLYISWVGRSIVDNGERPPSVLVGQLRDHLAAGWRLADHEGDDGGPALLKALTSVHPLQPFSRTYFPTQQQFAERSVPDRRLITHAQEWREVHSDTRSAPGIGELGEFLQDTPLTLNQLGNFLRDPAKAFFNTRLRVFFEQEDVTSLDQEPFTLDGLENWQLQDTLIQAQRRAVEEGLSREAAMHDTLERLQGQGVLAMGAFGERMRRALVEPMDDLFAAYREALEQWPQAIDEPAPVRLAFFDKELAGTPALEDWLDNLRTNDEGQRCRLLLTSSSLIRQGSGRGQYQWHHLLRPWVAHLAGHLDDMPLTTQVLSKAGHVTLPPLEPETARAHLRELIAAWQLGMRTPLPLATATAFAWLGKEGTPENGMDSDAWKAAAGAYEGDGFNAGEVGRNPYLAHRWPSFAVLFDAHRGTPDDFASLTERLLAPVYRAVKGGGQ
ncbi:DNA helicase/exodeoxyribonuclease V, gamma subunit [Modicisalibacter ilicicola DSM 19980]|uniref:RecBCD enzyme subunit RecC n=1 Tax=Modicisalibacter ilicicola DSM 19980 TaxID=1121942 RepID=A0A1M4TM62_9GAMM|nr:exodeoxyribonuclease V subunit gamma [Halomonas ilicicola]SHE45495.1 DNA helicase/exodeoxyribonuclease V, gamma subunit [Halomonas ilicicola DSM 19980]